MKETCEYYNCYGLTSVTYNAYNATNCKDPSILNSKPWFENCPLTTLNIGEGVERIPDSLACGQSRLTSITIPASVTSIGYRAFEGCSGLTSVTVPDSVTFIGGVAFANTPWYDSKSVGMVYIGKVAYKYKGEMPRGNSVVIKKGTVSISPFAFDGCSNLTSVTICNSVTSIGHRAFEGCIGLTSVTIPSSVTKIGDRALYCEYLREIYSLNPEPPEIGEETFCPSYASGFKLRVYVPEGSISKYKKARYWERFKSFHAVVVPHDDGVTDGDDDLK